MIKTILISVYFASAILVPFGLAMNFFRALRELKQNGMVVEKFCFNPLACVGEILKLILASTIPVVNSVLAIIFSTEAFYNNFYNDLLQLATNSLKN